MSELLFQGPVCSSELNEAPVTEAPVEFQALVTA